MIPLIIVLVSETVAWNGPSYTSPWIAIQSQNYAARTNTISHSLGEYPAKVDVQVKVAYNGNDYIFTAAGAPQVGDDSSVDYGTVIYTYNAVHVRLSFPYGSGTSYSHATGGVVFTGSSTEYNGPWNDRINSGYARVRLWKLSDFPTPLFTKYTWISSKTTTDCFKEIQFNAGVYPDLVTVQTRLHDDSNNDVGYVSDGQGAVFLADTNRDHELLSGVVYGYDDNKVRLWVAKRYSSFTYTYNGAVYATEDGWIPKESYPNGNVTIRGYIFPPSNKVFEKTISATTSSAGTNTADWSSVLEDVDNAYISVQVKADAADTNNPGMLFYAAGSAQSSGISDYGGVIYAYRGDHALLWTPTSARGHLIYIAERWGDDQMSTVTSNADIIIRVYSDGLQCPQPETVTNANYDVTAITEGGIVAYTCAPPYIYGSGNLNRTCDSTGNWTGTLPSCIEYVRCEDPSLVPFTTYVLSGYDIGDMVNYSCNDDYYHGAGALTLTCLDGIWNGTTPECWPSGCSVPDLVEKSSNTTTNAPLSTSRYPTGTVISYGCDSEYTLIGVSSRRCKENGNWDGTCSTCIVIKCPTPDSIGNGSYTPTAIEYLPGSLITYQCDSAYDMIGGSVSRNCNTNGSWYGVPPACAASGCPVPDLVENSSNTTTNALLSTSRYPTGTVISYSCDSEYTLIGVSSRRCQENGNWDGTCSTCIASGCPVPNLVVNSSNTTTNALLSTSRYPTGTVISYSCDSEYTLIGVSSRRCQENGNWDGTCSTCIVIKCPTPDSIGNGSYTPSAIDYLPGSLITYQCDSEYDMIGGSVSRNCNTNGSWDGVPPACVVIKCPTPDSIGNGSYTPSTIEYLPGSSITYQCDSEYDMIGGSVSRNCNTNGSWDGVPPACAVIKCPTPDSIGNGSYTPSTIEYLPGSSITYQCDSEYDMIGGSVSRNCNTNGSWDGVPPTCAVIKCPTPDSIGNGSYTPSAIEYLPGSLITYQCDSEYDMIGGSVSLNCNANGSWDGVPPACVETRCADPGPVSNASYVVNGFHPAETAVYTCYNGTSRVSGDFTRTCQSDGTWSGLPVVCSGSSVTCTADIQCPIPDSIGNGSYTPLKNDYLPSSLITYQCDSGFDMTPGSVLRTCNVNGSWDGVPPACVETRCADPGPVSNASYVVNGFHPAETAVYTCDNGTSRVSGDFTRTCQSDGTWSGLPVVCSGSSVTCTADIKCPIPDSIGNGSYTPLKSDYLPSSLITYQCDSGFDMTPGSVSRICNVNGSWGGVPPACVETRCADPGPVSNASYTVNGFHPAETAVYTCDNGTSRVSGDFTRTCQSDGTWSGLPVVCSGSSVTCTADIKCPIPDSIGNGSYTPLKSDYLPSSLITYQCDSGFDMTPGSVSRICNVNGSWDGVPPACIVIKCPIPDSIGNGSYTPSVIVIEFLPGSLITYQCDSGYDMIGGSVSRKCNTNGLWDGVPPACAEASCVDPGPVFNASYIINGFHPSETAVYTCDAGTSRVSGDFTRTCQSNGTWSGLPVVCSGGAVACATVVSNTGLHIMTDEELTQRVSELQQELIVEYKSTSSYFRSLNSASDDRPSSSYIAIGWTIAIFSVFGSLIVADCIGIYGHIKNYNNIFKSK